MMFNSIITDGTLQKVVPIFEVPECSQVGFSNTLYCLFNRKFLIDKIFTYFKQYTNLYRKIITCIVIDTQYIHLVDLHCQPDSLFECTMLFIYSY